MRGPIRCREHRRGHLPRKINKQHQFPFFPHTLSRLHEEGALSCPDEVVCTDEMTG